MARSYPSQPVVGVGAILLERDRVLLVRRGRPPQQGAWSLPGGGLELGESLADGLRREVLEETGLEVEVGPLVEVFERIIPDDEGRIAYHYILIDYLCRPTGGRLAAGDDADDARWFRRNEIAELGVTSGTPAVIEKAFALRDGPPPPP